MKSSCRRALRIGRSYLAEAPVASADFMEGIEDLPVQEREAANAALHARHGHLLLHHEALAATRS